MFLGIATTWEGIEDTLGYLGFKSFWGSFDELLLLAEEAVVEEFSLALDLFRRFDALSNLPTGCFLIG
jgi:hypothetical protein